MQIGELSEEILRRQHLRRAIHDPFARLLRVTVRTINSHRCDYDTHPCVLLQVVVLEIRATANGEDHRFLERQK